jgi:phosphatidylglycerophosphate synthase
MRRMSPYLTRLLLPTRLSANAVTWSMLVVGLVAAFMLSLDSVVAAGAAVVLIQIQVLLDCSDGELARWRKQFSPAGIYVDRLAHYVTETAFPIALGIRADGGWDSIGGWTQLGLLVALIAALIRMESALVDVARAQAGRPVVADTEEVAAPTRTLLRRLRQAAGRLPFYRALVAPEAAMLAFGAAIGDATAGEHVGTRVLVGTLLPIAAITALGHLFAILTSNRLR